MFKRIKTLWYLSSIDLNDKDNYFRNLSLTSVEGLKQRVRMKKLAKIIDVDEEEQFPLKNETL